MRLLHIGVPAPRPAVTGPGPSGPTLSWSALFWAWLTVRTAAWIGATTVAYPNPPLDLVEWLSWGNTPAWGYPKHPPLPAWVAAAFARLSPGDVWGVYVGSYLVTAATLVAAWRLGREYLPPGYALLAAACLDGLAYLTGDPAEFSNNVMLNAGWAWTVVCLHRAVYTRATWWWAATGLALGAAFLCKYTILLLLAPVGVWCLIDPAARRNWTRPGPYVAAAVGLAVAAPHLVWLARHGFVTLAYARERAQDPGGWTAHLENPLEFLVSQLAVLVPVAAVLYPVLARTGGDRRPVPGLGFLHAVALGPLAAHLAVGLLTGSCSVEDIRVSDGRCRPARGGWPRRPGCCSCGPSGPTRSSASTRS